MGFKDCYPLRVPERLTLDYDWQQKLNFCSWENHVLDHLEVNPRPRLLWEGHTVDNQVVNQEPVFLPNGQELNCPNACISDQV